jgi:indole-3-acetate monooxygenase
MMSVLTKGTETGMRAPGVPEPRMACLPKGADRIVDTWSFGGLRGTGSHDVVMDNVFVPAEQTCSLLDPDQLDRPRSRMPFFATMAAECAAICLGIAQAAIDTLLELGASKMLVSPRPELREQPAVQATVAASVAAVGAPRLLLYDALNDV